MGDSVIALKDLRKKTIREGLHSLSQRQLTPGESIRYLTYQLSIVSLDSIPVVSQ